MSPKSWDKELMVLSGKAALAKLHHCSEQMLMNDSAATNQETGGGVAIKKVTNVFSKKILAKRALREIKLLQHFRGEYYSGCFEATLTM
jgi:hypothetical protein